MSKTHLFTLLILISFGLSGCTRQQGIMHADAMAPTIKQGEMIEFVPAKSIKRFEIVVFKSPLVGREPSVLRVVGLPGEKIEITEKGVFANNNRLAMVYPPDLIPTNSAGARPVEFPYALSSDGYFLMGDNLKNANDSRFFGEITERDIIGVVKLRRNQR